MTPLVLTSKWAVTYSVTFVLKYSNSVQGYWSIFYFSMFEWHVYHTDILFMGEAWHDLDVGVRRKQRDDYVRDRKRRGRNKDKGKKKRRKDNQRMRHAKMTEKGAKVFYYWNYIYIAWEGYIRQMLPDQNFAFLQNKQICRYMSYSLARASSRTSPSLGSPSRANPRASVPTTRSAPG